MDVWYITVAVVRRWYVFLPLMVLTALGTLQIGQATPTEHEVSATAVLLSGEAESTSSSPYGGRGDTAQVLTIVLDSPASRDAIEAQGLLRDYEISSGRDSAILEVTVVGESEQQALDTSQAVIDLAGEELTTRQAESGIPKAARLRMQVLQSPFVSDVVAEGKLRNMAVAGVLGGGLSLLVAVLFDDIVGLVRRWRRTRRDRLTATTAAEESPPPTVADDEEPAASTEPETDDATEHRTNGSVEKTRPNGRTSPQRRSGRRRADVTRSGASSPDRRA